MKEDNEGLRLRGGVIAGGTGSRPRVLNDYYATDPQSVRAFLNIRPITKMPIWEPACGEGHICEVLKEYYPNAHIRCSDLVDRGYGEGGVDFLFEFPKKRYGTIITNPPFSKATEFIVHALEFADEVIIFGKLQFLEGARRHKLLFSKKMLSSVYVFSKRQQVWRNGEQKDEKGRRWSSTMAFAWFIFKKNNDKETIVRWI